MNSMFSKCSSLTSLYLSNFKTSKVKNMGSMFLSCSKLISLNLSNFDTSQISVMISMFNGCSSLISLDLSHFNTSSVKVMSLMFSGCSSLISLDLSHFNTSNATAIHSMFFGCSNLKSLDLLNFNTSKVTNMRLMFSGCSNLISLDLSKFDTSKVKNISSIFSDCSQLKYLNLSSFSTLNVTCMSSMFYKCSSLTSLDLSNFNTSSVLDLSSMFYECSNLTTLDLSNFDTSKVTSMSSMFDGCSNLESLNLSNFITSKVSTMYKMFDECSNLKSLDLSNFDTSQVTSMSSMFHVCSNLESLNISFFNTKKVNDMSSMFSRCSSLKSLDLSSFNTSNVTSMNYMFAYCQFNPLNLSNFDTSKVKSMIGMFFQSNFSILDLSNFNTSQVINMSYMFRNTLYSSLNLSNFNTRNVKDMTYMFYQCFSLVSLDLSNFDTSKVTRTTSIFEQCSSLRTLNISNINTSNINDMSNMFNGCSSITSLDLSHFDTSRVTNMNQIFYNCESLSSLNISNFNTSNTTDINRMFYNCKSLSSLNLLNFDTFKVTNMSNMFYNCIKLKMLNLSNFDILNVKDMNHMFYNCPQISSLELSNFNITNVENFNEIFYGCVSLEYIHLNIININPNSTFENIFSLTPDNLIVCTDNDDYKFINILQMSKIIQCNNSFHKIKYICYMKNSFLHNMHLCDICQKALLINYSELNDSTTNNGCYELQNDDNNIFTEFTNYLLSESTIFNSTFTNNYNNKTTYFYNDSNITSDNSELSLRSENYQYSTTYSSEIRFNLSINTIIQKEEKNETMQNIISNLIKEFNVIEIDGGKDKTITEESKTIILTSTQNQKNNEEKNYISMDLGECENILKRNYNIQNNNSLYILQIISGEEGMKIPKLEYEVYYPLYNNNNLTKLNLSLCKDTKIEISISVQINDSLDKYNPKSDYYNDICSKGTSDSGTDISLKDRKNEYINNNMSLCEENCDLVGYNPDKEKAKCSCDIKLSIPSNYDIKFNKKDFLKSFTDINNIININIMKCYKTILSINSLKKNIGFFIIGSVVIFFFIDLIIFMSISFSNIKKEIYNLIFKLKIKGNPIKNKKKSKKKIKGIYLEKNDNKNNPDKTMKLLKYQGQSTQNITDNLSKKNNIKKYNIRGKKNKYEHNILAQKDFELNSLDYNEALKFDYRNYCQYYFSLLKYNHPILFSFGTYDDYNSKVIKIFLFFFSLCLDLTVNALFFNDDTMHKIYEDKGKFNLLYQIPQIIYSALISGFINSFIRNFALTQDNIIELKQERVKIHIEQKINKLIFKLKFKFIIFFISTFIILIFLWYYITCFCGIYINTQIHLIKDSIISLVASLLIPFVLYTIPGIFRISSLRVEKPTRKLLYNFSLFLENLLC